MPTITYPHIIISSLCYKGKVNVVLQLTEKDLKLLNIRQTMTKIKIISRRLRPEYDLIRYLKLGRLTTMSLNSLIVSSTPTQQYMYCLNYEIDSTYSNFTGKRIIRSSLGLL